METIHRSLLSPKHFSERHRSFPESSLRYLIHHANENRMDEFGVIVRIGRRVYLDESRFF